MENVVTRSKFVNETISVVFDFSDQLGSGEAISSCTIVVSLFTGTDSDPSSILYQVPLISGSTIDQKFRLGIPGCIYEISFLVSGSLGTHAEKVTNLAILPQDGVAVPDFTVIYETSCLYPYEFIDSLYSGVELLHWSMGYKGLPEGLNSAVFFNTAYIIGGLITYTDGPENLSSSIMWVLGTVGGTIITYNNPPENLSSTVSWISGSVIGTFISYTDPHEDLSSNIVWFSGSIM